MSKSLSRLSAMSPRVNATICLTAFCLLSCLALAQNHPIRVIAFGAHPDDCDLGAGGLAAKYAAHGEHHKGRKKHKHHAE